MMKWSILIVWILYLVSSCSTQQSEKNVNGWKLSQINYDKTFVETLKEEINSNTYKEINSIIVIKNGELLIEEYFNGGGRDQTHDARSVGKTFASAMLGIAINEGYLSNVDQSLQEFYHLEDYPNFSEKKQNVKLLNLITMSSGFEGDDNNPSSLGNEENMYPKNNWIKWALSLPMATDRNPGDSSVYFTAGVVILGDILNKLVPGGLEVYTNEKLFEPLGINNYQWKYTPQDVVSTAGGIQLTPLDFAKFGQLYLSGGKWNEQQVIPEEWIDATMTRYFETSFDNNGYGYLMWNKKYLIGDKYFDTFYCSGNGGNKIFVFKELNAVIVITASAYNQRYAHSQVDEMMIRYIIPSLLIIK